MPDPVAEEWVRHAAAAADVARRRRRPAAALPCGASRQDGTPTRRPLATSVRARIPRAGAVRPSGPAPRHSWRRPSANGRSPSSNRAPAAEAELRPAGAAVRWLPAPARWVGLVAVAEVRPRTLPGRQAAAPVPCDANLTQSLLFSLLRSLPGRLGAGL